MRKNTLDTFKAWREGRTYKGGGAAIWTDGVDIFSYSTRIVELEGADIVFNRNTYSKTTSCHQNGLRFLLSQAGLKWQETDEES